MRRPILTIALLLALLQVDAQAQKRKDLHGKTPDPALRIEHSGNKAGEPTQHATGTSKKSKLEHGTRDAHPPREKAGVQADHHRSGPVIHRKGSKQGHYKKPVKNE